MTLGNRFKSRIGDAGPGDQRSGGRYVWVALVYLLLPWAVFAEPPRPVYAITDFVTCESARTNAPHDWHVPQAAFRTTDDRFFAWVELRDVEGRHPVEMKLYRPDGAYYGQETQPINETNGIASWWRMVAWWKIKGEKIAQTPGAWRLDLVIDGALQRSITLTVSPGSPGPALSAGPSPGLLNPPVPNQPARLWVVQTSVDLVHWTSIQTNVLLSSGAHAMTSANERFRMTLGGRGGRSCILEASTDSVNWMPLQTNDLSLLDGASAGLATARFYRAAVQ
jgi:hypothetical protein